MNDHTRSDIRLGDLSALDPASTEAPGPRLTSPPPDVTVVAQPPVVAGHGHRPPPAAPSRLPLSTLVLGSLVMLLIGVVIFLVVGQRDLQRSLATLEAKNRESVETLANRVSSTSTTLKSADSETQRSLNLLAADIAKLDAGAVRLGKGIEQQARLQTDAAGELKTVATELRRLAQVDSQNEARLKSLADTLETLGARQKTLADGLTRLERSGEAAQLRSEVAMLSESLRDLQTDYDKRLKASEQAQASNDAFRRQVNATIDRLNQQVSELYQRR